MERGTFHNSEVQELFKEYSLLEVYTDRAWEREHYGKIQKEIAGTTALPTYVILDSEKQLEVTRGYYTNSDEQFVEFLREGLKNRPGFFSLIRFINLNGVELEGPLDSYAGEEIRLENEMRLVYEDTFWATQQLRIPSDLKPGRYVVWVELITALYRGDERPEVISVQTKLPFDVIN